jgi:protein N-terminal methyltransferase
MQVDLVEPVSHFLEAARENLTGCMDQGEDSHKAANFYCVPLQVLLIDRDRSLDIL